MFIYSKITSQGETRVKIIFSRTTIAKHDTVINNLTNICNIFTNLSNFGFFFAFVIIYFMIEKEREIKACIEM